MSFQSTRPRGARPSSRPRLVEARCFNPRARAGRDRRWRKGCAEEPVSIHAPARGATSVHGTFATYLYVSIHAPARGATSRRREVRLSSLFQSTRPRGARQGTGLKPVPWAEFQSTRPRGARQCRIPLSPLHYGVSIHAPARGATRLPRPDQAHDSSFNPRARAGRDQTDQLLGPCLQGFNPRARAGRDLCTPPILRHRQVSIHAPARGATLAA